MLFNSFEFLLFFPLVTLIYFAIPHKYRWFHLLLASCVFYSFFIPIYILILFFTIIIDYYAGIWIEQSHGKKRKSALIMSLVANIGVLSVFKYYNFFIDNFNSILFKINPDQLLPHWDIILPIGLSFHTFQAMSYTIEVYRGNQKAERHFGIYALYVMFYPQLVAGPIERPQNVIHQFYEKHEFNYELAKSGLRLMLWGMFKKVVIADRLSIFVNKVYGQPTDYQGLPLIVATLFFTFQIYCDFSGYSDIAIGSARVMGFDLMKNFDRPYFSKNISEFWRRWHISLSTWFRDYLYIPLGGNRVAEYRRYFNLFFVFMMSGLWHGASWHFVIWGALHGIYLIFGQLTKRFQETVLGLLKIQLLQNIIHASITFILVAFAWIFFAAHNNADSIYIIKHLFSQNSHSISQIIEIIGENDLYLILISVFILEFVQWQQRGKLIANHFESKPKWQQWMAYYLILLMILCFGVYNNSQFIYFQF
ncbi:MBOAT family O-acyltransferase [Emticicia aquatica]|nr:MBOAT family O-acyltransferase [Emticicia aquatica]